MRGLTGKARYEWERKEFDSWFKNHVATYEEITTPKGINIEILTWRQPESSIYFIRYIKNRGTLSVSGDVGDAIYQWHHSIGSMECIAGLEVDYFASKCMASENGRGYKEWNEDEAKKDIEDYITECEKEWDDEEKALDIREKFAILDGNEALSSMGEWHAWLHENGYEFFGDDYYEFGNIGTVVDMRCHSHLYGLKLAIKQLTERGDLPC
jgi:hypothetical protein